MDVDMLCYLVEVAQLPKENEQLLVKLDLLGGVGQIGLGQRVGQQAGQSFQDKVIVLEREMTAGERERG